MLEDTPDEDKEEKLKSSKHLLDRYMVIQFRKSKLDDQVIKMIGSNIASRISAG